MTPNPNTAQPLHTPIAPSAFDAFAFNPSPANAVRLAIEDHKAGMIDGPFLDAINRARNICETFFDPNELLFLKSCVMAAEHLENMRGGSRDYAFESETEAIKSKLDTALALART